MELAPEEIEALRALLSVEHDPLCPKCGHRRVDPRSEEGWCVQCSARRWRHLEAKRRWWQANRGTGLADGEAQ